MNLQNKHPYFQDFTMKSFFTRYRPGKWLDRVLAGPVTKQIVLLTLAFCLLLFAGTGGAWLLKLNGHDPSMVDNRQYDLFWWVFLHAANPGNISMETGAPAAVKWFAGMITIAGWVLLGGLLITLLTNSYWKRVTSARNGRNRYPFAGHSVILGWDRMGISLIRTLYRNRHGENPRTGRKGPMHEIVVLTPLDARELRSKIRSSLPDSIERHLYVLNGELVEEELEKLHLEEAREVIVLGQPGIAGGNNKNLELAVTTAKVVSQRKDNKLPCYVHLPSPSAYDLLQGIDFPRASAKSVVFRPFNFHEDWARRVWNLLPGDKTRNHASMQFGRLDAAGDQYAHFVIVGFGKMGQALTRYTARMAHFHTSCPTRITVIDQTLGDKRDSFLAQTPGIRMITDIDLEFIETSVYSTIRGKLATWATDGGRQLTITICVSDPDRALNIAMTLPPEIREAQIPVLVRQARMEGFSSWIQNARKDAHGDASDWRHLRFFGWRDQFYDFKHQDQLACAIHQDYLEKARSDGSYRRNTRQHSPWEDLPECFRWSNRYQADMIAVKLRRLGRVVSKAGPGESGDPFTAGEIELLARMEHDRWWAERLLDGWRHGVARDDARRIHPDLVPYDQLTGAIKEYDRNTVRNIAMLLKKFHGLEVGGRSKTPVNDGREQEGKGIGTNSDR